MKVAAIIPDRGDRPELIQQCFKYLEQQTVPFDHIEHVNYPPKGMYPDLTERVRTAYNKLNDKYDYLAIIENDDWYSDQYVSIMTSEIEKAGYPDLLGLRTTVYYHIGKDKHNRIQHTSHASLFTTWIKGGLNIEWPADDNKQLDIAIWKQHKGYLSLASCAIGIKHGIGKCGGIGHTTMRYLHDGPPTGLYLSKDLPFYDKLAKQLKPLKP